MQYLNNNSCYDMIIIILLLAFTYYFIVKSIRSKENFAEDNDDYQGFEFFVGEALNNNFTEEYWEHIKDLPLMYPDVTNMLEALGKTPKTYTMTVNDYYKGKKESFIVDLLQAYSKN
tara:strand:+ start:3795 stop:4145 length:351 start_codon:yes stop_codon:yes gene_type:complete